MLWCPPSKVNLYVGGLFHGGTLCSTCIWAFPWGKLTLCSRTLCTEHPIYSMHDNQCIQGVVSIVTETIKRLS